MAIGTQEKESPLSVEAETFERVKVFAKYCIRIYQIISIFCSSYLLSDLAVSQQPVDDVEPGDSVSNDLRRGSDMSGIPGSTVSDILEIPDQTRLEQAYQDHLNTGLGLSNIHTSESIRSLGDIDVKHRNSSAGSTNPNQVCPPICKA